MSYIASYITFFGYITYYTEKNPVCCDIIITNMCYTTGYVTNFCYITGYITHKKQHNRLYMPFWNQTPCWDVMKLPIVPFAVPLASFSETTNSASSPGCSSCLGFLIC